MRLISGRLRERSKKVAAPLTRGVFLVPVTITSVGLLAGFYSLNLRDQLSLRTGRRDGRAGVRL